MSSTKSFRIPLLALAASVGCYGIVSGAAEMTALDRPDFPEDSTKTNLASPARAEWLGAVSPLRSDLEASQALILGLQAIEQSGSGHRGDGESELARSRLGRALSVTPYDAELWLTLAVLEARRDPNGPAAIESLKMAYLTAPSEARIMPLRLSTATRFDALADPDLRELARSDARLMLTRQPDQKSSFLSVYRQASSRGKSFLEDAAQSIDPAFLTELRG